METIHLLFLIIWKKGIGIKMVRLLVLELRGRSHNNGLTDNYFFPLCFYCLYASISVPKKFLSLQFTFYFVVYSCFLAVGAKRKLLRVGAMAYLLNLYPMICLEQWLVNSIVWIKLFCWVFWGGIVFLLFYFVQFSPHLRCIITACNWIPLHLFKILFQIIKIILNFEHGYCQSLLLAQKSKCAWCLIYLWLNMKWHLWNIIYALR